MKHPRNLVPVASVRAPKYPTREQALAHPSMLCALPRRWARHPAVCAALLFTVTSGLSACSSSAAASVPFSTEPVSTQAPEENTTFPASSAVEAPVPSCENAPEPTPGPNLLDANIPVFVHGMGRGSYGCESVAPPVFLSEEEALQVIREEAAAQGIAFQESLTISGTFPATSLDPMPDQPATATFDGDITLDGYSSTLKIGIEFVSQQDVADWAKPDDVMATVETYDMLDTAQRLSDTAPGVAVFYDPSSNDWEEFEDVYDYQEAAYVAAQKEKSIEDLRAQVRDFLQWLSAQGVI